MTNGIKIQTFWSTLLRKAHAHGQAKLHGTPEEIEATRIDLEEYEALCLKYEMVMDSPMIHNAPKKKEERVSYAVNW